MLRQLFHPDKLAFTSMCAAYVIFGVTSALVSATSAQYTLADKYIGPEFFTYFTWQTLDGPMDGRVDYGR